MGQGPRTVSWFQHMVHHFYLDVDGQIIERSSGLPVCTDSASFEWKTLVMYDTAEVLRLTPSQLVSRVQEDTQNWHIDAFRRALAVQRHLRVFTGVPEVRLITNRFGRERLVVDLRPFNWA